MEYLWLLVAVITLVVYPVVLFRSAAKGRRWALETLQAMTFLGGEMSSTSAWRDLSAQRRVEHGTSEAKPQDAPVQSVEGGRLVA